MILLLPRYATDARDQGRPAPHEINPDLADKILAMSSITAVSLL